MCKNLESPHPLTPSPKYGRRRNRKELCRPSPIIARGDGVRVERLRVLIGMLPLNFL
jgi:hypothetical protein